VVLFKRVLTIQMTALCCGALFHNTEKGKITIFPVLKLSATASETMK